MSRRALIAVCLFAFALIAAAMPGVRPASAAGDLSVELVSQSPAVLTDESDITLALRVTNGTASTIADPIAEVRLQSWTPVARERIDDWLTGADDGATTPLLDTTLQPLRPGEERTITLTIAREDLPSLSRGPRGLLVRVTPATLSDGAGDEASGDQAAVARTYLVNWPDDSLPPGAFLVIGAATASREDIMAAPDSTEASRELTAATQTLTDAGVLLATDPSVTNLAGPTSLALPAGDPDIAFLASSPAGREILAATSRDMAAPLAWWPTSATAQAVAARPPGAVLVVRDDEARLPAETYYTPSGIATIDGAPALVIDSVMSKHLTANGNDTAHTQALLAHAAAAIRERPNDPRTFVLAVDRDADAKRAADRLAALTGAPLSIPGQLPALTDDAWDQDEELTSTLWQLPEIAGNSDSADLVRELTDAQAGAAAVAALTASPTEFTDTMGILAEHLLATSLSGQSADRSELLTQLTERAAQLSNAITVETPSSLLLISDQPDIPIHLNSTLTEPATVVVDLIAQDPRLQTPGPVTAVLEPGARTTVAMPVSAVGSGDLKVRVQIASTSGDSIASSDVFDVRVRADWESVGTAVVAGLLALLVIGGIIRTIRRHRDGSTRQRIKERSWFESGA